MRDPAIPLSDVSVSVLDGDAGDVGTLQGPAYRLGLIAIEAGEARPEQLLVALGDHRFGERVGLGGDVLRRGGGRRIGPSAAAARDRSPPNGNAVLR